MEYRLQSMYNHMVGRTASVVSPFYSLLPDIFPNPGSVIAEHIEILEYKDNGYMICWVPFNTVVTRNLWNNSTLRSFFQIINIVKDFIF